MKAYHCLLCLFPIMCYCQKMPPPPVIIVNPPMNDPSAVVFLYDSAGNQTYRGGQIARVNVNVDSNLLVYDPPATLASEVANRINVAPVPVVTTLTIIWDQSIRDYIMKIDLLAYNSFQIMASTDVRSKTDNTCTMNMGGYPYGVYYLRFYLSDGSVYTRTITKS